MYIICYQNWKQYSLIKTKHNFFKNSFFPSAIIEWNNLDPNLRNSNSISVFKEKILNFIRPSPNSVFDIRNPKGIKLITRLRLGLSHLREHKFKHSFQDTLNPLCNCGQDIESTTHFFLHCPFFINERRTLLSTMHSFDSKLLDSTDYDLIQMLLFYTPRYFPVYWYLAIVYFVCLCFLYFYIFTWNEV